MAEYMNIYIACVPACGDITYFYINEQSPVQLHFTFEILFIVRLFFNCEFHHFDENILHVFLCFFAYSPWILLTSLQRYTKPQHVPCGIPILLFRVLLIITRTDCYASETPEMLFTVAVSLENIAQKINGYLYHLFLHINFFVCARLLALI